MNWTLYLWEMAPYLILGAVVIGIVVVVNRHGIQIGAIKTVLAVLELRIANLHKARERARVRSLQVPPQTPRPPPLSGARTTEVDESMFLRDTQKVPTKEREE